MVGFVLMVTGSLFRGGEIWSWLVVFEVLVLVTGRFVSFSPTRNENYVLLII
jgi:hypothetical protein